MYQWVIAIFCVMFNYHAPHSVPTQKWTNNAKLSQTILFNFICQCCLLCFDINQQMKWLQQTQQDMQSQGLNHSICLLQKHGFLWIRWGLERVGHFHLYSWYFVLQAVPSICTRKFGQGCSKSRTGDPFNIFTNLFPSYTSSCKCCANTLPICICVVQKRSNDTSIKNSVYSHQ